MSGSYGDDGRARMDGDRTSGVGIADGTEAYFVEKSGADTAHPIDMYAGSGVRAANNEFPDEPRLHESVCIKDGSDGKDRDDADSTAVEDIDSPRGLPPTVVECASVDAGEVAVQPECRPATRDGLEISAARPIETQREHNDCGGGDDERPTVSWTDDRSTAAEIELKIDAVPPRDKEDGAKHPTEADYPETEPRDTSANVGTTGTNLVVVAESDGGPAVAEEDGSGCDVEAERRSDPSPNAACAREPADTTAGADVAAVSGDVCDDTPGTGGRLRLPRALSIEVERGVLVTVVEKLAELPVTVSVEVVTTDVQQWIGVYSGDGGRPHENAFLGRVRLYEPARYDRLVKRIAIRAVLTIRVDEHGYCSIDRKCRCTMVERPGNGDSSPPAVTVSEPTVVEVDSRPGRTAGRRRPKCLICGPPVKKKKKSFLDRVGLFIFRTFCCFGCCSGD